MSNLLEQAIIDATALKEAAYKSAVATLEDKYSQELKESVEKILEQEEQPEQAQEDDTEPPKMEIPGAEEKTTASEKAFDKVPSSFLDGPDDELITITFDEIKKEIKQAMGGEEENVSDDQSPEVQNAMNPDGSLNVPPEQAAAAAAAATPAAPSPMAPQTAANAPMQEALELDEDLLLEMINGESDDVELDENILLEMSSCGSYENEEQDELEENLGGDLDSSGDSAERELEEGSNGNPSDSNMQVGPTSGPNALANASKESEQAAKDAQDKAQHSKQLNQATTDLAKANQAVQTFEAQLNIAKKNAATAKQNLTSLQGQSLEEAEIAMDYDPFSDTSGYLRTSKQDQKKQFKATLAKIKVKLREELQEFINENLKLKKQLTKKEQEFKLVSSRLTEYHSAYNQLTEEVENLSISNAKLLYTNKVLDNNSLNERQKQTVVEALSRTNSVNEAKTIYDTLQSAVQTVSEKKNKESLSEALNRGSSPFLVRKNHHGDDNLSERMKILAGIKK